MKNKRGQAALEFLMTYGWAILVVLVVIGALSYFGVLNPKMLMPEKCTLPSGFSCEDHLITADGTGTGHDSIVFKIRNGFGKTMQITNFTTDTDSGTTRCEINGTRPVTILNSKSKTIGLNCTGPLLDNGQKISLSTNVTYYFLESGEGFAHVAQGDLFARVE